MSGRSTAWRRGWLAFVMLAFGLATAAPARAADANADDHLRAGAEHFRAGRFAEALVEFQVAQKLGAGDEARFYAGAALAKLGRADEALEAFGPEQPLGKDPLLDFYRGLACYQARLYVCANRLFSSVARQGGPRLAEQAGRSLSLIAAVLQQVPEGVAVDAYRERGELLWRSGLRSAARLYFAEASATGHRRPDCHGCAAADAALSRGEPPEAEPNR